MTVGLGRRGRPRGTSRAIEVAGPPTGTGRLESVALGPFELDDGTTLPGLTVAYRHDGPGPGRGPAGPGDPRTDRLRRRGRRLVGAAHRARPGARHGPGRRAGREPARWPLRHDRTDVDSIPRPGARTGPAFPAVSTRDQARAQWRSLDALGIDRLELVVGGSLGGMVALEVALARPDAVRTVMPIAAPAATGPMAIAWNHLQIELIDRLGLDGLALARELAMTTYRSEADFDERFGRSTEARRDAFDRQLSRPPGPQADRPVRSGDVPDPRRGDGPPRHRRRVGAGSTGRSRRLATGGTRLTGRRHRGRHPVRPATGPRARRMGAGCRCRARRTGRSTRPRATTRSWSSGTS